MIFITGGNFQFLDASAAMYESERLVNTTDIVVVLIQYRLGKKNGNFENDVII
jgi:carboxylesterase type B